MAMREFGEIDGSIAICGDPPSKCNVKLESVFNMQLEDNTFSEDLPAMLGNDFHKLAHRTRSTSTPWCSHKMASISTDSAYLTGSADSSAFNESIMTTTYTDACTLSDTFPSCNMWPTASKSTNHETMVPKLNLVDEIMDCSHHESVDDSGIHSDLSLTSNMFSSLDNMSPNCHPPNQPDVLPVACTPASLNLQKVHRPLTSTPSTDQVLQLQIEKVLKDFSPIVPDRLIGRKMGLKEVDIISELSLRNLSEPLNLVAEYLGEDDVCSMCLVNKQWRDVCYTYPSIRRKIVLTKAEYQDDKENFPKPKTPTSARATTGGFGPLQAVQEVAEAKTFDLQEQIRIIPPLNRQTLFDRFTEEAADLKNDESLRKCPRCMKPARVHLIQERAWCSRKQCGFDFCIKCNSKFHGSKQCSPVSSKKNRTDGTVTSRKSKKNLRRL